MAHPVSSGKARAARPPTSAPKQPPRQPAVFGFNCTGFTHHHSQVHGKFVLLLLFGFFCCLGFPGACIFAVCGVCFFCCLGGWRFLLLFGRGMGVHSLTELPGSPVRGSTTKKDQTTKTTRIPQAHLQLRHVHKVPQFLGEARYRPQAVLATRSFLFEGESDILAQSSHVLLGFCQVKRSHLAF